MGQGLSPILKLVGVWFLTCPRTQSFGIPSIRFAHCALPRRRADHQLHGGGIMNTTLPLASAGFGAAKAAAVAGRRTSSLRLCSALLATTKLPSTTAAKAHRLAASLDGSAGRYPAARRHLREAARMAPDHAATRYRLGQAFEQDPFGSDLLAAKHYRAAAKRERGNAGYRAAFGRAAVRAGYHRAGCRVLVKAAKMAPTDAAVLAVVIDGLLIAGRARTARHVMTQARFLLGHDAKITALWHRVRFAESQEAQQTPRSGLVLPFVRLASNPLGDVVGGIVRKDLPSRPRPHLTRLVARKHRG